MHGPFCEFFFRLVVFPALRILLTKRMSFFSRIQENCDGAVVKTVEEARALEPLKKAIQKGLDAANKKAISRAQVVQKFEILSTDFSIPGEELGTWKFFSLFSIKNHQQVFFLEKFGFFFRIFLFKTFLEFFFKFFFRFFFQNFPSQILICTLPFFVFL